MKNKDLFDLQIVLDEIVKTNYKAKVSFSFAIIKNKKAIELRVEELKEAIKPSEDFMEYDKERIELLKEHSQDEKGNIKTKDIGNGNIEYLIQPSKADSFKKEIDVLKEKHKVALEERDIKEKEIEEFLEKEVEDLDIKKIAPELIPDEFKTTHLERIFILLKDD